MQVVNDFEDYKILDLKDGKKLESWNGIILDRPDPEVIWPSVNNEDWSKAQAKYDRSESGGGSWSSKQVPSSWQIHYKDLTSCTSLRSSSAPAPSSGSCSRAMWCAS